MKPLLTLTLPLLLIATPSLAQTIMTLTGTCQKAVIGKHDMSKFCGTRLLNTSYPDGRVGFYFTVGDLSLMFTGIDQPNPTPNSDETKIDEVSLSKGMSFGDQRPQKATGKCTFGNPYGHKVKIRCLGKVASGEQFDAVFLTDGRDPQ